MEKTLRDVAAEAGVHGLKLHPDKTKVHSNCKCGKRANIQICDGTIEVLQEVGFVKYLGRKLTVHRCHELEFEHRIAAAWASFSGRKQELTNKRYPFKARLRLFNATVGATVLYGSEALTLKQDERRRLRTTQRKMLRMVLGVKRRVEETNSSDSGSNDTNEGQSEASTEGALEPWSDFLARTAKLVEDRLAAAGEEEWRKTWCRRKCHWAGRLARTERHKWSHTALIWNPSLHRQTGGRRAQARPHKRWDEDFAKVLQYRGVIKPWLEVAQDRKVWESFEEDFVLQAAL